MSAWKKQTAQREKRRSFFQKKRCHVTLSGSYTVEASLVFSLILLIILSVVLLGFSIYSEGVSYVRETVVEHRDSDGIFRMLSLGKDVLSTVWH